MLARLGLNILKKPWDWRLYDQWPVNCSFLKPSKRDFHSDKSSKAAIIMSWMELNFLVCGLIPHTHAHTQACTHIKKTALSEVAIHLGYTSWQTGMESNQHSCVRLWSYDGDHQIKRLCWKFVWKSWKSRQKQQQRNYWILLSFIKVSIRDGSKISIVALGMLSVYLYFVIVIRFIELVCF